MRKILGSAFLTVGLVMLYEFAVWGAVHAKTGPDKAHGALPFSSLGANFPFDALALAAALWGIGLGAWYLLKPADPAGRPMSQLFLANSLLLLTSVVAAFLGAALEANRMSVAVFTVMAFLQIATGLFLCILAVFEKPRGVVGLSVGGALYAACAAVTLVAFLGA